MSALPTARDMRPGAGAGAEETVALTYDARLLRRRRLVAASGLAFLVDLPRTTSLDHGDALVLEDGRRVGVEAAPEALLRVTASGTDLPRLAWHVGNRHAPAQIEADGLLVQRDPVMAKMLTGLGAEIAEVTAPFTPEGGAYGHGRTMGHDHGHSHGPGDHGHHHHEHGHEHGHGNGHHHAPDGHAHSHDT